MLYKELLILVAMMSAGSQAVPKKCIWSDDMCEQCFLNCDRRHCDDGGTAYSCCEKCSANSALCANGYCLEYREICLSDQTVSTKAPPDQTTSTTAPLDQTTSTTAPPNQTTSTTAPPNQTTSTTAPPDKEPDCTSERPLPTPNLCNQTIPPNVPCRCNGIASTTLPPVKEPDSENKPSDEEPDWKKIREVLRALLGLCVLAIICLVLCLGLGCTTKTFCNRGKSFGKKCCSPRCLQKDSGRTSGSPLQTGLSRAAPLVAEETAFLPTEEAGQATQEGAGQSTQEGAGQSQQEGAGQSQQEGAGQSQQAEVVAGVLGRLIRCENERSYAKTLIELKKTLTEYKTIPNDMKQQYEKKKKKVILDILSQSLSHGRQSNSGGEGPEAEMPGATELDLLLPGPFSTKSDSLIRRPSSSNPGEMNFADFKLFDIYDMVESHWKMYSSRQCCDGQVGVDTNQPG